MTIHYRAIYLEIDIRHLSIENKGQLIFVTTALIGGWSLNISFDSRVPEYSGLRRRRYG